MREPAIRAAATPRTPIEPPARNTVRAPAARALVRESAFQAWWGTLRTVVASSCGTDHPENEDAASALDGDAPLFVVADGVGGGANAARASSELVAHLHATLDASRLDAHAVRAALLDADRAIERRLGHGHGSGAATVALCAGSGARLLRWLVAWVGDCRVYHVEGDGRSSAALLTVDDTYRALGEVPPAGGSPDDPARMVGNGAVDSPNVRTLLLRSNDMLVVCSDGVHRYTTAAEIARLLQDRGSLAERCARLVGRARARGSRDDATVLVVRREAAGARSKGNVRRDLTDAAAKVEGDEP